MSASLKKMRPLTLCQTVLKKRIVSNHERCRCLSSTSSSTTAGNQLRKSTNYCINLVRQNDYEGFLSTLMYPEEIRNGVFAIRAFNVETAQIEDSVKERMAGTGRIQFWKDTIDNIYKGTPPQAPVALELAEVLKKHKLTKRWFQRILEARASKLDTNRYGTIEEMETYSENTASSLMYLHLECLGIKNVHADHAASHLGRSHGLVTLLRAAPYVGKKGKVYLPLDLMAKHKVSQEDVLRGKREQEVCDIAYEIACVAKQHLETARSLSKDVPKEALPVLLTSVICERYLKKLEKARFFIYHPSLQKKDGFLPLRLWIQKTRKKY